MGGALLPTTVVTTSTSSSSLTNLHKLQHQQAQGQQQQQQLGTLQGVYFPCLQSILGVILFLRLTHITSQAGCFFTSLLIIISSTSTLLTWSSLSAIVTNGQIQGSSGPYYVISRTLGADIGCSLGLLYYIGSILTCCMYVLGAAEAVQHSIRAYYARWGYGFSGHIFPYDVQVLSILMVIFAAVCVHVGTKYVTLFSNIFLCVTLGSVLCMTMGCILFALGIEDGNLQPYDRSFMENIWPRYEPDPYTGEIPDIFSCLALIYPCVTGMLGGMSKVVYLKSPSKSVPKGMFWAIITSTLVYLAVTWLFGMTISNRTLKVDKFVTASVSFPHEIVVRAGVVISCLGLILGCMATAPNLVVAMSSDDVLPFLQFLRLANEDDRPTMALWFTALMIALPTLCGNIDLLAPYATIFYLLMYSGVNAATCISGLVRAPGFRPTFRFFHWSVSFVGFAWCLGLSFCISGVGTFVSVLAFLLLFAYIKKARRLAKSGVKWGTLGNAVRYNIVSSALNSLAKSAASSSFPTEVTMPMTEESIHLNGMDFSSDGSVLSGSLDREECVHFQQPASEFHAKNWRPQLLTIMDVDYSGTPTNLHVMSLAAQLQRTGRGINVVISIIDRSQAAKAASVASAMHSICAEIDDSSVISEMTGTSGLAPAQIKRSDRWKNEEVIDNHSLKTGGIDHIDTIKLIQRAKAIIMFQMRREGMDGFAEVSTTDGKWFEAVWSAVIHTGLGPLSPNTILLSLPTFLAFQEDTMETKDDVDDSNTESSIAFEHDKNRAEEYLRTVNGILNLGKAVILFKGCQAYPGNGTLLPERGTIDIWWVVHDGGLLLLLPFLLSKHEVWAGENNQTGNKKKLRRKKKLGGKLRLFAVTTRREEDPEMLREAVVGHLERVRIQAEVIVVDCLAEANVADHMRDWESAQVVPGLSSRYEGSADKAVSMLGSEMRQKVGLSNPVASLRKDGISTHNMTLGEVFASQSSNDHYLQTIDEIDGRSPPEVKEPADTAALLNEAMRRFSSDANLVVANLPFIHKNQKAQSYFHFIDRAFDGIDNVMLVRGSGAEVITAYG